MHRYDIRDVWMSISLSIKNFFILLLSIWLFLPLVFFLIVTLLNESADSASDFFSKNIAVLIMIGFFLTLFVFIQSIIIYLANRKYLIDLSAGIIVFPRSDMENSILQIILLSPYWNLMRRKTVHALEVENIYIDTKRWTSKSKSFINGKKINKKNVRYTLNIAGTFGSANLQFLERQKRDEVRNAIQQCVKKHSGKNIDRKVAEFS